MSKETITIKAEVRAGQGKGPAGRLRHTGWLPAVVYTEGQAGSPVQVNEHDFGLLMRHHTSEHMVMDLAIGTQKPLKVLLKEVQHHPVSGRVIHLDFNEISMTKKLRVGIPLRLAGDPEGVTQQGGILDHLLRTVEVECLPGDLMEEIVIDVSHLALGKHLSVSDIQLDPLKYRIVTSGAIAIAAVSAPKAEEVAAPIEGAGTVPGAEPEVLTAKKPEEGAEGAAADDKKGGKEAAGGKEKAAAGKDKAAGGKPEKK